MTELDLLVRSVSSPAPQIRSFTLTAPGGEALPSFVPGSHLVVRAGSRRNAYSLTGDGVAPASYQISVLRVADGLGGSRWMHDLDEGDRIGAQLPRSGFAPVARAAKHLLVAGGIGVTPMVSHLRAAHRWGRSTQVLYTARAGHAAHLDEVTRLSGGAAELFGDRRAFGSRLHMVLREQPIGTHLYVCGPAAMIDDVLSAAATAGWPSSRVHAERFGADALDAGDPFTVELTRTGLTLDVPAGTSLLEALEAAGLELPSLCRQGVCGECRIPLTGGTPLHRDLYLGPEQKAAADAIMPCVSRAAAGVTLEVPL